MDDTGVRLTDTSEPASDERGHVQLPRSVNEQNGVQRDDVVEDDVRTDNPPGSTTTCARGAPFVFSNRGQNTPGIDKLVNFFALRP
jgi:hypothetical protein